MRRRPEREKVSDLRQGNGVEARLRQAADLPEMLAAGFDAFEAIRMAARDYQDQVPGLFAAFMTTADAAVDGAKPSPSRHHYPSAAAPCATLQCRRVPTRVRPPRLWPRSRPCSLIVSEMPLPWRARPLTGPPAWTPRRRPGGSAS